MSIAYDGIIYEQISVDVSRDNEFAPLLVKQKDAYTRGYIITITKDGDVMNVPNSTQVWFNCQNKADATKRASVEGSVNNHGTVTVVVPEVVMEVPGYIQCDLSLITVENDDTHILKSTLFYLLCEEAANPEGTTSAAEDSILAKIASGTLDVPGSWVPKTRTIADVDLQDNITKAELQTALELDKKISIVDAYEGSTIPTGAVAVDSAEDSKTLYRYFNDANARIGWMICASCPDYYNTQFRFGYDGSLAFRRRSSGGTYPSTWSYFVQNTRTIAGVDLVDNITAAELKAALSVPTKTSDITNDSGFLTQHQDISGKVDKTQKIAGIELDGNIPKGELYDALASKLYLTMVVNGTTTAYPGQYGKTVDNEPMMCVNFTDREWIQLARMSDISGKLDKQTTIPSVVTTTSQGQTVPNTSDSDYQALAPTQLFQCEIAEVPHIYMKISSTWYIEIGDMATKSYVDFVIGGIENGSY